MQVAAGNNDDNFNDIYITQTAAIDVSIDAWCSTWWQEKKHEHILYSNISDHKPRCVFLCNSHIPDNLIADKAQKGRT